VPEAGLNAGLVTMMILVMAAAVYAIATGALYWIATKLRGTVVAWPYAFVAGAAAAFAMEFAAEILLMQTFGVIPGNQPWPVVTWGLIAVATIAIAGTAMPSGIPITIPCVINALLALQYGLRLDKPASTYAGVLTAVVGLSCLFVVPKLFAIEKLGYPEETGGGRSGKSP